MSEHSFNGIDLILTLSLIIWGSPFLSKLIKIPTPPIEIVLGSLATYFGFIGSHEHFDLVAKVGFLYLMFLAGMEVNLKEILGSSSKILQGAFLFIIVMNILSGIIGGLLGMNVITVISLPLISIGILASLSKVYGKEQPWLKLAFIVGVLGEIVSIATLTILEVASVVGFSLELFVKLGYLVLFLFAVYSLYKLLKVLFWWYPELKSSLMPSFDTSDQDVRLAISLFFILIIIMMLLHLELALGSFIAGVAISTFFHHKKQLEEKMSSFGFGFLVPIFFIHVGSSFDLSALALSGIISGALLIAVTMIVIRILSAFVLRGIHGKPQAVLVAFALSMPLTLLIAVATVGYGAHLIDLLTYYQLILASLFEIIVSMVAIKILQSMHGHARS